MGFDEGMARRPRAARLRRASCCVAIGALVLLGTSGISARAGDDDDSATIDEKIIGGVLDGIGLRPKPDIDYRERSPLVVPPSLTLPKPENDAAIEKTNPAWPVDADVKRRREARRPHQQTPVNWEKDMRPLTPDELNAGRRSGSTDEATPDEAGRTMSPSELGFKGFDDMKTMFGFSHKDEVKTFVKEPERATLIDPPPGYRTPSAAQPYGIGQKAAPASRSGIEHHGEDAEIK